MARRRRSHQIEVKIKRERDEYEAHYHMGEDSHGTGFPSIEALWTCELGDEEKKGDWYSKSMDYWDRKEATTNGVLAGHETVSPVDLEASINFLRKIGNLPDSKGGSCSFERALDCGAGVGRVTAGCLSQLFQKTDLLEPVRHLMETAKLALSSNPRVGDFIEDGLQHFTPEPNRYDCIWLQWCVLYLTDEDLVQLLRRCKQNMRPNVISRCPNLTHIDQGIVCIKENVVLDGEGFYLDREDNSLMRTDLHYRKLFAAAELKIVLEMRQPKFPKALFPVYMYALR